MNENQNRAFLYGESVFTTMRVSEGQAFDQEEHLDRLEKGVEFVFGPFEEGDSWRELFRQRFIEELCKITTTKVVRITVYRAQTMSGLRQGMMAAKDLHFSTISSPLATEHLHLRLSTCPSFNRPSWWPSFLKAGDYLPTILSQRKYLSPGFDDLLFLSDTGTTLESSIANIFVVRHNKLFTAPVGPQVLDGVMRKKVIDQHSPLFTSVRFEGSTLQQLHCADAVFGSNSVRGVFLIDRINDHSYSYTPDFIAAFEDWRQKVMT